MSEKTHTNRLAKETSPYLLQHAHNPVDWYAWGEEALARARAEDKPILLSIGYSACHWCHVMEHESFENEQIAEIMNRHFINIKVDREERPDLDSIYQNAVQLFGQNGGWPLTMFLTPDQEPFFGGTYFPPDNRSGHPGFPSVLLSVAQYYRTERAKIVEGVQQVHKGLEQLNQAPKAAEETATAELLENAAESLARHFDSAYGGFGTQPKFPNTFVLSFFFRMGRRTGNAEYTRMASTTLRRMAEGGIFDQLGGGYHRYTVDAQWLIPHFEKMLYDNALLVRNNLEALQATGDPLFERATRKTLEFVSREMASPQGGFYATLDADSGGAEGKYYVWTPDEIHEVLGPEAGKVFCAYYGVTGQGNFEEGTTVLSVCGSPKHMSYDLGLPEEKIGPLLEEGSRKLQERREKRARPFRDEKIITSWNGLMISAFAEAAKVLDDKRFQATACRAADFVLKHLCQGSALRRAWKDGQAARKGFLDDYAFFTAALLDLFELTRDRQYLEQGISLMQVALNQFWDDRARGFFLTPRDHERLIQRPKPAYDLSLPSGNSICVMNLMRLFSMTEQVDLRERALEVLQLYAPAMAQNPFGFANMLCGLDASLEGLLEIVLVGNPDDAETKNLLRRIHRTYQPNKVLFLLGPNEELPENAPEILKGKKARGGRPTAYVCRNFTCSPPVTTWEELEPLLGSGPPHPESPVTR